MRKLMFIIGIVITLVVVFLLVSSFYHKQNNKTLSAKEIKELYNPEGNVVAGNKNGSITMVEFLDYRSKRCSYATPIIQDFLRIHPNVRVVYKEIIFLGKKSKLPDYAALAATKQHKYLGMHTALLMHKKPLTLREIEDLARQQQLDMEQFFQDINNPTLHEQISFNTKLAHDLKINRIPTIIFVKTLNHNKPYKITGNITFTKLTNALNEVK